MANFGLVKMSCVQQNRVRIIDWIHIPKVFVIIYSFNFFLFLCSSPNIYSIRRSSINLWTIFDSFSKFRSASLQYSISSVLFLLTILISDIVIIIQHFPRMLVESATYNRIMICTSVNSLASHSDFILNQTSQFTAYRPPKQYKLSLYANTFNFLSCVYLFYIKCKQRDSCRHRCVYTKKCDKRWII